MEHHFCVDDATPMKRQNTLQPSIQNIVGLCKAQIKFMHFKLDVLEDSNVIKSVVDLQLRNLLR